MLKALIKESPGGGVIAYVKKLYSDNIKAHRIWEIETSHYKKGKMEDLQKAFSKDSSDWPPKTFLFVIESYNDFEIVFRVATYYDKGLSPRSRGGNESLWTWRKQPDGWKLIKKETSIHWD